MTEPKNDKDETLKHASTAIEAEAGETDMAEEGGAAVIVIVIVACLLVLVVALVVACLLILVVALHYKRKLPACLYKFKLCDRISPPPLATPTSPTVLDELA